MYLVGLYIYYKMIHGPYNVPLIYIYFIAGIYVFREARYVTPIVTDIHGLHYGIACNFGGKFTVL